MALKPYRKWVFSLLFEEVILKYILMFRKNKGVTKAFLAMLYINVGDSCLINGAGQKKGYLHITNELLMNRVKKDRDENEIQIAFRHLVVTKG